MARSGSMFDPQFGLLFLIGIVMVVVTVSLMRQRDLSLPDLEGKSPMQARTEIMERVPSYPRWFRSDFDRLEAGQSWTDVQSILGDRGELVSQEGPATFRIRFRNKDGSHILVTIQNGKLVKKSQSGLREPPGP